MQNFKNLKKPDICDTIISVNETRNKWYLQNKSFDDNLSDVPNNGYLEENLNKKNEIIELQHRMLKEKEEEMHRKNEEDIERSMKLLEELANSRKEQERLKKKQEDEVNSIKKHVEDFQEQCGRKPMKDEIYENMKDLVDVGALNSFLENYGDDNV